MKFKLSSSKDKLFFSVVNVFFFFPEIIKNFDEINYELLVQFINRMISTKNNQTAMDEKKKQFFKKT